MRTLVLGASGMLGHKVLQELADHHECWGTARGPASDVERVVPNATGIITGVNANDFDTIVRAVAETHPTVIVNCIGIVKQLEEASDPLVSISVNSLFPHRLSLLAAASGARLVHISTDCVFTGDRGSYAESDVPDATDLYGRTKLLGEVTDSPALTLRTSIIGRELRGAHGLVEWFLSQNGDSVRGFRRAIFSGLTTAALSRAIADIIEHHPSLTGLWHVAAEAITKFDLLVLLRDEFSLNVHIEPADDFVCDRSLDGSRFVERTGIVAPAWAQMISELAQESVNYDRSRVT